MEFIKHNRLLKIHVSYDPDNGYHFEAFIQNSGIEPIGEHKYAYFPTTPRWTAEELNAMTEQERQEWHDCLDWDWTRYTLADVSWKEWYEVAQEEECLPYRYTATGYSQSDWLRLYLFGMEEHEAVCLLKEFEQYAFACPYWYQVELIDCETGETVTDESLGGIYDDTFDLRYLKCELKSTLNGMGEIPPELRDGALEAVNALESTDIVR
ncbi:MAG: hypothetical protein HXL32_09735 [Prevotellaceae bacterium]|nr:hypothetical protein [Prevotellaceae bacterium]